MTSPAPDPLEEHVDALVASMSLRDKLHQLSGDRRVWQLATMAFRYQEAAFRSGDDPDHGIPPLVFADGPRGVVLGRSTAFPVPMARGATFDPELEEEVGDAMGVELRSQGANLLGSVCVNVLRHPAWGRAQETYGEDPLHVGRMGAAAVRGIQRHAMACVKHFACNSIENSRMKVDVLVDERTLREHYLPHFEACVDAGAAVVMTAYNRVNGRWAAENPHLLREVLRDDWGFEGITISDWVFGVHDGVAAVRAGLDIEMPIALRFRALRRAVRRGELDERIVDEAVARVLRTKLRFAEVGEPDRYGPEAVAGPAHRELARRVARRSMVLLRNEPAPRHRPRVGLVGEGPAPVLPIDPASVSTLAVVGRLADLENTGDHGSSRVRPPEVVTPLAGLREAFGADVDVVASASDDPGRAVEAATGADVAIVVVGTTWRDEGEHLWLWGGDRDSLRLSPAHEALIERVSAVHPRTVVVVVAGSAVVVEPWRTRVPAIVMAWYPGMEGGHALAELLTGRANFTGRLPCVFARDATDLPPFDPSADQATYEYLHGYRWTAGRHYPVTYPFGFGLSYTQFAYGDLRLDQPEVMVGGTIRGEVEVTNTGDVAGTEIVQFYVSAQRSVVPRAPLDLVDFQRVDLAPGERARVRLELPVDRLAYWDLDEHRWTVEPTGYRVAAGPNAALETHATAQVQVVT